LGEKKGGDAIGGARRVVGENMVEKRTVKKTKKGRRKGEGGKKRGRQKREGSIQLLCRNSHRSLNKTDAWLDFAMFSSNRFIGIRRKGGRRSAKITSEPLGWGLPLPISGRIRAGEGVEGALSVRGFLCYKLVRETGGRGTGLKKGQKRQRDESRGEGGDRGLLGGTLKKVKRGR